MSVITLPLGTRNDYRVLLLDKFITHRHPAKVKGDQKLTVFLKSRHSSAVIVSALAINGIMFTLW